METKKEAKSIYESKELVKWGGLLNEFLWVCAGANRKVLRQCPTDYAKYAGIGGTILFTALMAMMSGGYALFFVFGDIYVAIAFGVFWGLLIFNLDRFIVNTMYSDGKVTISWREFYSGLPRIIMAIFLGIVISTPLELKIFESEINVRIGEDMKTKIEQYKEKDEQRRDSLTNKLIEIRDRPDAFPEDISLKGQAAQIQNTLKNKESTRAALGTQLWNKKRQLDLLDPKSKLFIKEQSRYNSLLSQYRQMGQEIRELQGQLAIVSEDYKKAIEVARKNKNDILESIKKQIAETDSAIQNAGAYEELIKKQYGGLEARMKAFHELREDNKSSTDIAAWFIMLLFIIIETAPTFFKMMIASGPYDDLLRAEMHRVRVLSDKRISDINDEINTEVQISTATNRGRLEAEVLANKELMEKIATAQAELLETAIEKWREEELAKIAKNPAAYIHQNGQ